MKILNIFIILVSFVISIDSFAQNQIYTILTIDDVNIEPTFISNSILKVDNHEMKLTYKVGRFEITSNEYEMLKKIDSTDKDAILSFVFTNNCSKKDYTYKIQLNLSLFLQEYLLLKIYNFHLYPNIFIKNTGYGFEYISPVISESLPRKTKQKNKCL